MVNFDSNNEIDVYNEYPVFCVLIVFIFIEKFVSPSTYNEHRVLFSFIYGSF